MRNALRHNPRLDIVDGVPTPQDLGEGLGLGVARQLGVARVGQQGAPQTRVHGAVHRLYPPLVAHAPNHHPYRATTQLIR